MSGTADRVAALFAAARTDAGLLQAALRVEEVAALAYAAAAESLAGAERAQALGFADHEREHAAAFDTMLQALTVPAREHAGQAQLDALRTVAAVMAGGAQHLVVLRHALGQTELTHAYETGR